MLKGTWTKVSVALLAGLSLFSTGCAGGSGSSSSGSGSAAMIIQSCSLSCNGGEGGTQISCGINQVAVNEGISVLFSQPVDLSTVNKNTFQVIDLATGKTPSGTFSLAPGDDKVLIFRPQMTFDASGNPIFGLVEDHSYLVFLPGENQDPGSQLIRSTNGKGNVSRMSCTVVARFILDPVAGPPTVTVSVDVVTQAVPLAVESQIASGGAFLTEVWNETDIRFSFNDIMNPATLVNPVSGQSNTLKVFIDPDGNINDPSDRVQLFGDFSISIDENNFLTEVVFSPSVGLPSSGTGLFPRAIVVELPASVADLGGNSLTNTGAVIFIPEFVLFPAVVMPAGGEQFITPTYLDSKKSGAAWEGGALLRSFFGGSGRLGPLVLDENQPILELNTDSQVWSNFDVIHEGASVFPPSSTPPTTTITDGIFEFSSIRIEPGTQLIFKGSNPVRLFGRGEVELQGAGQIVISGDVPSDELLNPKGHNSELLDGGDGGPSGPGAGAGGSGGDRPNDTNITLLVIGGSANPGAVITGRDGGGVGGVPGAGSGLGGTHWPLVLPTQADDLSTLIMDQVCKVDMVSGPGSGGAFATSGEEGVPSLLDPFLNPPVGNPPVGILPPPTPGGDATGVGLTTETRKLSPELGNLVGGAGGGGGGMSFVRTQTNGTAFVECTINKAIKTYWTHSAAGGGGGGGAIEIHGGKLVKIDGSIDAQGGDGGDTKGSVGSFARTDQASPGGGGAGGAILLRSASVQVADVSNRLVIKGGKGGVGVGHFPGSFAGDGGIGLVRIEATEVPDAASLAKNINPYNPSPGSETGGPTSSNILSVGPYSPVFTGPAGRSGAQSCWVIPEGNFFVLEFQEDDVSDPLNPNLGWDCDVILNLPGLPPFSLRDATDDDNPLGVAPVDLIGTDLGGGTPSPLVIRFQGVHSIKAIEDICNVDLKDPLGAVDPQSLTPWVRHPFELNDYWDLALPGNPELAVKRKPNMIRYQVIFDGNAPLTEIIAGLTNFRIKGRPD
jgi:hypothetical protein